MARANRVAAREAAESIAVWCADTWTGSEPVVVSALAARIRGVMDDYDIPAQDVVSAIELWASEGTSRVRQGNPGGYIDQSLDGLVSRWLKVKPADDRTSYYKVRLVPGSGVLHLGSWTEPEVVLAENGTIADVKADWIDDPARFDKIGFAHWPSITMVTWRTHRANTTTGGEGHSDAL
jgi:hypothetical protein